VKLADRLVEGPAQLSLHGTRSCGRSQPGGWGDLAVWSVWRPFSLVAVTGLVPDLPTALPAALARPFLRGPTAGACEQPSNSRAGAGSLSVAWAATAPPVTPSGPVSRKPAARLSRSPLCHEAPG